MYGRQVVVCALHQGKHMPQRSTGPSAAIDGDEFMMLRTTLEKWCQENRIGFSTAEAEIAAAQLIDAYQFGLRHPDQLTDLLRCRNLAERLKPSHVPAAIT